MEVEENLILQRVEKKILQIRAAEKKKAYSKKISQPPNPSPRRDRTPPQKYIVTQSLSWHTCPIIVTQRDTTVASLNIHKLCITYRLEVPKTISLVCFLDFLI